MNSTSSLSPVRVFHTLYYIILIKALSNIGVYLLIAPRFGHTVEHNQGHNNHGKHRNIAGHLL